MNCIAEYLRDNSSTDKPVLSKELQQHFHVDGRQVRRSVHDARCNGVPICISDDGYFYSEDDADIRRTMLTLESRSREISEAAEGLRRLLE